MSDAAAIAAAAAAATPPPGANGATPPWYAAADTETVGFFQNRGLDKKTAPEAAMQLAKDFRETQSKLGIPADRVMRIPEPTDAEGWKAIHQRLGVPADPAAYDFSTVMRADGSPLDEGFATFARTLAAQLNLPKDAAPALAAAIVKHGADAETSERTAAAAARAVATDALDRNWGENREANKFIANRTATLLGLTQEILDAIPPAVYPAFMEKLREAGSRMGEAALLGHGGGNGGAPGMPMTREGAVARLAELRNDKPFYERLMAKDAVATQEWNNLNRMAAGTPR